MSLEASPGARATTPRHSATSQPYRDLIKWMGWRATGTDLIFITTATTVLFKQYKHTMHNIFTRKDSKKYEEEDSILWKKVESLFSVVEAVELGTEDLYVNVESYTFHLLCNDGE